jgi:hypothetical protein
MKSDDDDDWFEAETAAVMTEIDGVGLYSYGLARSVLTGCAFLVYNLAPLSWALVPGVKLVSVTAEGMLEKTEGENASNPTVVFSIHFYLFHFQKSRQ